MFIRTFYVICLSIVLTMAATAQGTAAADAALSQNAGSTDTKRTKRGPVFRPTKDQIIQVQIKLKEKQLYAGDASGKFNGETRTGIKSFQKDNGLKQTGTLNRATLEKFEVDLTEQQKLIPVSESSFATAEPEKDSTAKASLTAKTGTNKKVIFRANAEQIRAAQKLLKSKAMYAGEETGKLDEATRSGIKKFQDENGVKVTGTLNAVTLEKMGVPLTDKQKVPAAAAKDLK